MNHTDFSMPRAGRTVDRMSTDHGWAAWHYPAERNGWAGIALACAIGVAFAAVLFFNL